MSIVKTLSCITESKLVIPCAGKMFYSNISKEGKALCLVINKGYIETATLADMLQVLESFTVKDKSVVKVGNIDKVRIKKKGIIVYRQRLFFKSIKNILNICKKSGIKFELSSDFKVTINNIMNVIEDLPTLEVIAHRYDETIDTWLTNCCIIHLHNMLLSQKMYSNLGGRVAYVLRDKNGYMDRAPFLISSYSIDNKSSAVFIEQGNLIQKGMYSVPIYNGNDLAIGYTTDNLAKDRKAGVLK